MTSRGIAACAAVVVMLLTIVDVAVLRVLDTSASFIYTGSVRITLYLLVAICAGIAARRFNWWSEHLGRAWTLFAISYAVLCGAEICKRFYRDVPLAEELLLVVANLTLIGAYWLIARSFRVAGLRYYGSTARKITFTAITVILALLLVQGSIVTGVQSLRSSSPQPGQLLSATADLITFLLAAPLLLMAFSLRGGHLFWMFTLLTVGTFGWMFNQGSAWLFRLIGWEGGVVIARNFGFAMACCCIAAAALVQWLEVHRGTKVTDAHA